MKKILVAGLMLTVVFCLFAEIMQADNFGPKPVIGKTNKIAADSRDMNVPVITWGVTPKTVKAANYYDYQMGAYDGSALQVQPTTLGVYLSYMFRGVALASGHRTVNFAYMDQTSSQPQYEGTLTDNSSNEGFVTMALDPVTQNPFFAWHAQYTATETGGAADAYLGVYLTADNYASLPAPGSLFPETKVIANTSDEFEYIWPVIQIGTSPIAGMRRMYVFAGNSGSKTTDGNPSSNCKMAWADFNDTTFDGSTLDLTWHYVNFPYLDAIHNTPLTARAFTAYCVKDNKVILGGFVSADKGISTPADSTVLLYQPHDVFYLVNETYGEGDFQTYTFSSKQSVSNPVDSLGVVDNTYFNFEIQTSFAGHKNLVFDNFNRLHFVGNYATTFLESATAPESERKYWPYTMSVKDVIFDLGDRDTLRITDLDPVSSNPVDNKLFAGWDLEGDDNIPDSFNDEDGKWEFAYYNIPIVYHDSEDFFHYNYFRQTEASPEGYMAALWSSTSKCYQNLVLQDETQAAFANRPEIVMAFSKDNGRTWSKPLYINNSAPELANMIPTFSYLAPEIQILPNGQGRVHWMFLNDNSYGSFVQADGTNTGGNVMYAAIDVDFNQFTAVDNPTTTPVKVSMLKQNYPNPFNPTTTISFDMKSAGKANLAVYNVKGQLVKTLVNDNLTAGSHSILWNGLDNNNKQASSGVYFYKLSTNNHNEMKKMVLVK